MSSFSRKFLLRNKPIGTNQVTIIHLVSSRSSNKQYTHRQTVTLLVNNDYFTPYKPFWSHKIEYIRLIDGRFTVCASIDCHFGICHDHDETKLSVTVFVIFGVHCPTTNTFIGNRNYPEPIEHDVTCQCQWKELRKFTQIQWNSLDIFCHIKCVTNFCNANDTVTHCPSVMVNFIVIQNDCGKFTVPCTNRILMPTVQSLDHNEAIEAHRMEFKNSKFQYGNLENKKK